jgi:hypothetical protein
MVAGLRRGRQVVSSVIGEGIPRVHHVGRSARSFGIFPNRKFSEVFASSSIARLRWQAALQPKAPLSSPIALSLVDSSSAWSARLDGARSSYAIALPSSNRPPVGPSGGNRTPHRDAGRTLLHRSWRARPAHVAADPSGTYRVYKNPPRRSRPRKQPGRESGGPAGQAAGSR